MNKQKWLRVAPSAELRRGGIKFECENMIGQYDKSEVENFKKWFQDMKLLKEIRLEPNTERE